VERREVLPWFLKRRPRSPFHHHTAPIVQMVCSDAYIQTALRGTVKNVVVRHAVKSGLLLLAIVGLLVSQPVALSFGHNAPHHRCSLCGPGHLPVLPGPSQILLVRPIELFEDCPCEEHPVQPPQQWVLACSPRAPPA